MKQASVVVIIKDGLILSVSRRANRNTFGLIGGKIDLGETPREAAFREVKEETGLSILECEEFFQHEETPELVGGEPFFTYCFLATLWEGTPVASSEGELAWLTVEELTGSKSAFPEYNRLAIDELKKKYPLVYLIEMPFTLH